MKSSKDVTPVVCTKHRRYIPCRPCMYREPDGGGRWDSSDPLDVEAVRVYQHGEFHD